MTKQQRTVLIVDDSPEDQETLRRYLMRNQDIAYTCVAVQTAEEGLRQCHVLQPDVVLLDYKLPDDDGLSLLAKLLDVPGRHAVIMLTSFGSEAIAVRAIKLGAQDYLVKDARVEPYLDMTIENAIDKANLQQQVKQQRRELEASNRRLQQVLDEQQASLAQLNLALNATRMATWEWDLATNRVKWGTGLETMPYMKDGPFSAFLELVHPSDRALVQGALDNALRDGTAYETEFRLFGPAGSVRWVASRGHVVRDERGKPVRMLGIDMDVTERKLAEVALRSSEERLRAIWESASDGMALSDAEGIVLDANSAYCEMYGYQPDQLIGQSFTIVFPPSQRAWALEQYRETVRNRVMLPSYESSIQRGDGETRFVESRATLLPTGDGELGMLSIIRDITARAREEDARARALEQERQAREAAELAADYNRRLQQATAALGAALTPEQVAEIILVQGVEALGARAATLVTLTNDRAMLETFHQIGYPSGVMSHWQRFPLDADMPLPEAVRTGQPVLLESRAASISRYPQLRTLSDMFGDSAILAFPLKINNTVIGGLGMSFAETRIFSAHMLGFVTSLVEQCAQAFERARLYQAAEQARAEAQEAVREREAFLSIASHELKNPLTTLLGRAQLLQRRLSRTGDNSRAANDIDVIIKEGQRINTLLTDLLDSTWLETGQFTIESEPVELAALVDRVVTAIQLTTTAHIITMRSGEPSAVVAGDPSRLEQVFHNLISNAVKYSPSGGAITICLSVEDRFARVEIADNGLGIPAEALPHLFKRFYRVERDSIHQIAGSGIGLYVVKEIVAGHHGTIQVASTENVGTTFTVRLPLKL